MKKSYGKLKKEYRDNFAGGVNLYLGPRQIKDNESPDATNCDFKGKGGVGSRDGYSQIGTADATYNAGVKGMGTLHGASTHQLMRFVSNSSNVVMEHSTDGGSWTSVTGTTFSNVNIDGCQAGDNFYTGNGTDVMKHWSGATWTATSNGTKGFYPTFWGRRLWVVDETNLDTLNFSGQWGATGGDSEYIGEVAGATADKLGDFSDASAGYIRILPGSGSEITGLKAFKGSLYVFLTNAVYKIDPASAANTFSVTQITNSVGCVSHRSIAQVEEDLFFASRDGVYSLGEVENYVSVRTTNKSARVQEVFDNITSSNKMNLVGAYHNFKYHLFYSLYGGDNDSCLAFDVRYGGWQDWRNMAANSATLYTDSTSDVLLHFGHPSSSAVYKMYSGTDDDGTAISSVWYSKSFDEGEADITKIYFDHTFLLGQLNGTATLSVIFDDNEVSSTKSLTNQFPQGGLGRDALGRQPLGKTVNSVTVTRYAGLPLRIRAKDQKFAVQYRITSNATWQLDQISTTYIPLDHYKFRSDLKI